MSRRGARLLAAVALLALALGARTLRQRLIQAIFRITPVGAPAGLPGADPGAPTLPPAARLRIVLLDGLGAEEAATLPALGARCHSGLDLQLDVGFPTVSLPVQAALWTGRTQQHGGIQFRIGRLPSPPEGALPARVAGSLAIAESHPEIVGSFGFAALQPFERGAFDAAAELAVRSDARLVFVHVLRIDHAGHEQGAASPEYHAAAQGADALLERLVQAEALAHPAGGTRWVVLADHGHLPGGGHGDAEAALRHTRTCLFGALPEGLTARVGAPIHLVNLARVLFDSLGTAPPADADGRTLSVALAAPALDATLPRPSAGRAAAALLALLLGVALELRGRRAMAHVSFRRKLAIALWWWVGTLSILLLVGMPSLSHEPVFQRWPWLALGASLPGALLLVLAAWPLGTGSVAALVGFGLALPLGCTLAALLLCGGEAALVATANPPLLPFVTALADLWLVLLATGALALALAALAAAGPAGSDPP